MSSPAHGRGCYRKPILSPRQALDYGCGSGNLTRHMIDLRLPTVSADVADGFLALIDEKFGATGLSSTLKINGRDLSTVADDTFDFVASYSVLHHVPDYLAIVEEMCRVTKPGGVLYLDHEVIEEYYQRPPVYVEFLKKARPSREFSSRYISLLLDVKGYPHILRRLNQPSLQAGRGTFTSGRTITSNGIRSSVFWKAMGSRRS